MVTLTVLLCFVALCFGEDSCCRHRSRIVRQFIHTKVLPMFDDPQLIIPAQCPFHPENDLYGRQEEHKYEENPSRWNCDICGKAFYDERFLDLHFENRHQNYLRNGKNVLCLADYCDTVRCEVIAGRRKPRYWDIALCKEHELQDRQKHCSETLSLCVPDTLSGSIRTKFSESLNSAVCRYLTCEKYWELPDPEVNPIHLAAYGLMCIFVVFGLIMYYYIAYTHFFTTDSLWDPSRDFQPNRDLSHRFQSDSVSSQFNDGKHHYHQKRRHAAQKR